MLALVLFSFSCSFATGLFGSGSSGPTSFTAALTAPDVVMLTWDAVEGATGYMLELSIDQGDSFPIVALPPGRISYEDLTAPEEGDLTYQVQAVTESGPAGSSQVSIRTAKREPDPLAVIPEYDEANAAAAVVGAQGGTLSLVDSNEVEYTLSIPAGALSSDTEIRMTAVTGIQDWPLDGDAIGAVRLEPEGLILNEVATLTIGVPFDVDPDLAMVGFAFQGDGQEFHLQPSDEENGLMDLLPFGPAHLASLAFQAPVRRIVLPVMELKVGGVGQTSHESVSRLVKDHAPSDPGAALEQKLAADHVPGDPELAPLENFNPVREEAYQIGKAISNAKNCGELNSQIVSFQKWRSSGSYSGLSIDQKRDYTKFIWDEITDKVKQVLEKAADECEKSGQPGSSASSVDSPCARALMDKIANPPTGTVSDFNLDLKNKLENKLSNSELQDIKDKLEKCKQKAYRILGKSSGVSFSGELCIDQPFDLNAAFPGGTAIENFTPSHATEGVVSESGGGSSCIQTGGGSYMITFNEQGSGELQWTVTATRTCPKVGSMTDTRTFVLPLLPAPGLSCP